MAMEDRDPGADTAMFRAYVDQPEPDAAAPPNRRTVWIAAGAVVVIAALVIALLVA